MYLGMAKYFNWGTSIEVHNINNKTDYQVGYVYSVGVN